MKTLSCPCLSVLILVLYYGGILYCWPQKETNFSIHVLLYTTSSLTCMSVRCKSFITEKINLWKLFWIFWTEWVWEGGSDWYWGETASKQNTGRTESPLTYPSPETFLLSLDRELIQCKGRLCTTLRFTDPQIREIVLTAGINDIYCKVANSVRFCQQGVLKFCAFQIIQ